MNSTKLRSFFEIEHFKLFSQTANYSTWIAPKALYDPLELQILLNPLEPVLTVILAKCNEISGHRWFIDRTPVYTASRMSFTLNRQI